LLTRSRLTSAARADLVGQAVVVPHGPAGRIAPPILACGLFRVTRIEDTVLGLARLADHEQTYFACAVVEEAVAETGAGRESDSIAGLQPMQLAIEPDIRRARDYVHELLFGTLGMGIGRAPTRQ
jgi:hypothetical protein